MAFFVAMALQHTGHGIVTYWTKNKFSIQTGKTLSGCHDGCMRQPENLAQKDYLPVGIKGK